LIPSHVSHLTQIVAHHLPLHDRSLSLSPSCILSHLVFVSLKLVAHHSPLHDLSLSLSLPRLIPSRVSQSSHHLSLDLSLSLNSASYRIMCFSQSPRHSSITSALTLSPPLSYPHLITSRVCLAQMVTHHSALHDLSLSLSLSHLILSRVSRVSQLPGPSSLTSA
jgi:hypothetical protein